MKIYYWAAMPLVFFMLWAGVCTGADPQGKDLIIPSLEGTKPLERGQIPKEKLYSLTTVPDADLKLVLFAFSKDSGLNIIVDPGIDEKIRADLKEMTLKAVLEAILNPLDLEYRQEGNLIRISRPKMETRFFSLNYLTTVRSGNSSVSGIGGSSGGTTTSTSGSSVSTSSGGGSLVSQVKTEDKADLWTEIKEGIQNLLTNKSGKKVLAEGQAVSSGSGLTETTKSATKVTSEGYETAGDGKFIINKMAGMVIVTDYPKRLQEVEKFLAKVEETVQRQVFIEAKVIEVSLNDNFQLGIDWQLIPNVMNMGVGGLIRQSLTGTSDYPANNRAQVGVSNANFNALVDALSTQGKVDVLSSPRVSTLNNQKAIIKAATEDVYFDVTIAAGTPPITTATPKYITIGVILDVTPQIDSDGTIIMDIHPSVTERIRTATFAETGQQAPIISVRETQTIVRVREGQTILIAGLMQTKENESLSGIPCLMNIPVAGEAFRQTRRDKNKFEIVILITPTIYTNKKIMDFTKEASKPLEELRSVPSTGRHDLVR